MESTCDRLSLSDNPHGNPQALPLVAATLDFLLTGQRSALAASPPGHGQAREEGVWCLARHVIADVVEWITLKQVALLKRAGCGASVHHVSNVASMVRHAAKIRDALLYAGCDVSGSSIRRLQAAEEEVSDAMALAASCAARAHAQGLSGECGTFRDVKIDARVFHGAPDAMIGGREARVPCARDFASVLNLARANLGALPGLDADAGIVTVLRAAEDMRFDPSNMHEAGGLPQLFTFMEGIERALFGAAARREWSSPHQVPICVPEASEMGRQASPPGRALRPRTPHGS